MCSSDLPHDISDSGGGLIDRLDVEKEEDLILPDRAADPTAQLIKPVIVSQHCIALAVEALVCIETGAMSCKEETSMEIVGAALGSDLNLGAAEARIFGIIAIGDNLYTFNRVLRRCDDGGAAPHSAGGADPVDGDAIILILLANG